MDKTYPEIGAFFESFVRNAEPLPIAEYYAKLGIRYDPTLEPRFGMIPGDLRTFEAGADIVKSEAYRQSMASRGRESHAHAE